MMCARRYTGQEETVTPIDVPEHSIVDLHLKHVAGDEVEVIYTLVDPQTYYPTAKQFSMRATAQEVFSAFPVTLEHRARVADGILRGRSEHLTRTTL